MRRSTVLVCAALVGPALLLGACVSQTSSADGRIKVVTTVSPITNIVQNVGGDFIDLTGIVPEGIATAQGTVEVDAIVFATGFDAMTGSILRIALTGRGGLTMQEKWADGPITYLGLAVHGFPNLFTITGPGSPSVLSNMVPSIEQHVDWIADCLVHLAEQGDDVIEADASAEREWTDQVHALGAMTIFPKANSWYMGRNIEGKPVGLLPFAGGTVLYRQICDGIAQGGYRGFTLGTPVAQPA